MAEQAEARSRLMKAREKSGKSPKELSVYVQNSISAYYDLENCDGDLYMTISLRSLSDLCSALGIKAKYLFLESERSASAISLNQLSSEIRNHLNETGLTISEFEHRIGFTIASSLVEPNEALNWNVDCLRLVCKEIGLNWRFVLP